MLHFFNISLICLYFLGSCASSYFDDGYLCVSEKFRIPLKSNIVQLIPQIDSDLFSSY